MFLFFRRRNKKKTETLSGNIRTDIKNILLINGKSKTYIHVANVADRNTSISKVYDLDQDKCVIAGVSKAAGCW